MFRSAFFVFCIFTCSQLVAQPVYVLSSKKSVELIGKSLLLYEDVGGRKNIEDILLPAVQAKFNQSNSVIPNFNVTTSTIWAKMRFTTSETNEWYVEYGLPSARNIAFYEQSGHLLTTKLAGIQTPLNRRTQLGHRALFKIDVSAGDTLTCYFKISDVTPVRFMIKAASLKRFFEDDHIVNFWNGIFFGVMLLMAIYNLFLFITNRNRVYIYYVFYVIFSSLFIAFFTGYIANFSEWALVFFRFMPTITPALFGVFGLLFTREFLSTSLYAPRIHKVITYFMISVSVPIFLPLFGFPHLGLFIIQLFGLILSVLSIAAGIIVLRKGYRPAKFYLIGFGSYMIGLIMVISSDFIGTTNEFTSMYSIQVGAVIEAVILSFAIGDKLNNANREKTAAQEKALEESQKNEKLIREQNSTLEQKVKERTYELNEQKLVVEEKNKEITDSINYAKRIQEAILPSQKLLNNYLPGSFILYLPKDIVAGDFYFLDKSHDRVIFAVADCTGHGVPGALVSVVCANAMHRAINEFDLTDPGKILDKTRELVIQTFDKNESNVRDGMDISLCIYNPVTNELLWAGANNSLVIIRNNQIHELLPDKMPIGRYEKQTPFTTQHFILQKNDVIYSYTDGYIDQFGGPKGKKFKESNLHKLLLSLNELSMEDQKNKLHWSIENWRGSLEQLDDICVLGFRI
jgi:serine phosphatase RsbU (regulator of sigma subunit)